MQRFLEFVGKWIELIIAFFKAYPLAAALVTIAAAAVYIVLWKHLDVDTWLKHTLLFLCVILGWAVLIPILGTLLKLPEVASRVIIWVYKKYESQPIFCISATGVVAALGSAWFFMPSRWRPSRLARVGIAVLTWFLLLALVVPILNAISERGQQKETPNKAIEATTNSTPSAPSVAPHR